MRSSPTSRTIARLVSGRLPGVLDLRFRLRLPLRISVLTLETRTPKASSTARRISSFERGVDDEHVGALVHQRIRLLRDDGLLKDQRCSAHLSPSSSSAASSVASSALWSAPPASSSASNGLGVAAVRRPYGSGLFRNVVRHGLAILRLALLSSSPSSAEAVSEAPPLAAPLRPARRGAAAPTVSSATSSSSGAVATAGRPETSSDRGRAGKRVVGEDDPVAAEDVISRELGGVDEIDIGEIVEGALRHDVVTFEHDEDAAFEAERVDRRHGDLGLREREAKRSSSRRHAHRRTVREGAPQRELDHLLRRALGVAARLRAEGHAATRPVRRADRALAGPARPLLAEGLGAATADLRPGLGALGAGAPRRELGRDHLVDAGTFE